MVKDMKLNKLPNPLKLDLGCGNNKQLSYIGVDKIKTPAVDIVMDLDKYPWVFEDESVDEVNCSHYVEHVENLVKFIDEIYRILKVGGKVNILAPYYSSVRAWQDPTHKRAISEYTFLYFNKQWRDQNKLEHYGIKSDFDFTYGYNMDTMWANRNEEARNFAIKHYINVVMDIQLVLVKRGEVKNVNI